MTLELTNLAGFGAARASYPGLDINTRLLLHGDGTLTDSSWNPKAVTAGGTAATSTDWFKFGTHGLRCPGTAGTNGSNFFSVATLGEISIDADFTLDFWVRFDGAANNQTFAGQSSGGGSVSKWVFGHGLDYVAGSAGKLVLNVIVGNPGVWHNHFWPWAPVANTAYHVALVRHDHDGGVYFGVFVDGVFQGWSGHSGGPVGVSSRPLALGCDAESYRMFQGYLDEVRWSNVARWTDAFTPPDGPYG